jgi:hypothetical protein
MIPAINNNEYTFGKEHNRISSEMGLKTDSSMAFDLIEG